MRFSYPAEMAQWPVPRTNLIGFTTTVVGAKNAAGTLAMDPARSAQSQGAVNRQRLTEALAAAAHADQVAVQWLQQVHGRDCVYATSESVLNSPMADAVWTDQTGVALAIQSADCVPVLFAHEHNKLIGAAHAGWRGLLGGVLEELINALPAAAEQLQAWIGPCISVRHFEVGEDVWGPVANECQDAVFAHPVDVNKRMVDLVTLTRQRLQNCGIKRIAAAQKCTYADTAFFSHRRTTVEQGAEATTGRMASVIMLAGDSR